MADPIIKVEGLNKLFKLPHEKQNSIKGLFVSAFRGKSTYEKQQVLKDISFEIKPGEFFGIVGRNGSGKSTLLKLLAGIYEPNKGNIQIKGSLTPFIELGVGFNPNLTGRENVFLNGALLGFNRKEMLAMYNDIVDFAELPKFMDQKLKNYSSGMQVRLAFSIAIRAKSDILLLDEVLAVGDAIFQKKCYDYFKQLKREGRTVVFVSHDTGALQEYCTNGILIEKGEIVKRGKIDAVVKDYVDILNKTERLQEDGLPSEQKRWGSGEVLVESIKLGTTEDRTKIFNEKEPIKINVKFRAQKDVESPVFGITILDMSGLAVFQSNTLWCKVPTSDMKAKDVTELNLEIPNVFNTGTYLVSPAVSDRSGAAVYDWCEDMARFKTTKVQKSHAMINTVHDISVTES